MTNGKGGKASGKSENVQVVLRVRPLSKKESESGCKDVVNVNLSENCVFVDGAGVDGRAWGFDAIFNSSFAQKDVYLQSIHPVVETVLQGYNATIFAYGQSGTGKTFSMVGNLGKPQQYGIIPHALDHIFSTINELRSEKMEYEVQCSFVELYNGKCRDLLVDGKLNLELKENAQKLFYVKDLSMYEIKDTLQAMAIMEDGITRREVKATELNSDSSRSHSLFTVYVKSWDKKEDLRTEAKLNLVDLAGSERQSKSGATGDTLKEGSNINLSLTALGTVIDCLVKGKPHIPYRSSPLTMLLKDGLGGNSRTVLVGTIGPSDMNAQETVSTLRFIDRAKQIKNKPRVQMDPKDARIAELQEEVRKLRKQLGLEEDGDGDDEEEPVNNAGGGARAGGANNSEEAPPQLMTARRRSTKMLVDDEIEGFKRRIEELEVALEAAASSGDAATQLASQYSAKERQLRDSLKQREQELVAEVEHLKDRISLSCDNNSNAIDQYEQLLSICTDFLITVDTEKQWVATVKPIKKKHAKKSVLPAAFSETDDEQNVIVPTVEDIARGLKMLQCNGVDMRMQIIRRTSLTGSHMLAAASSSTGQANAPHPPPGSNQDSNAFSRGISPQRPDTGSEFEAGTRPPGAEKRKKDKKDKKEKKEKKNKQQLGGCTTLLSLEQKASLAVLKNDVIERALRDGGVPDSARAVIDSLLAQQRTELLAAFKSRAAEQVSSREAAELLADKQHAAELLVAFAQLQEEVDVLHNSEGKTKAQMAKARAVAEKKISEVTQLKEHIDALRDELGGKQQQHAAEMAIQQDKLAAQFNKKMEAFVAKQSKNNGKERHVREQMDRKVDELNNRIAQLEQDYDTKIFEYETLLRDFESHKLESLKRFKDNVKQNNLLEAPQSDQRLRNVVQASLVLDRLSGKNQLVKTEELRMMPNSAPEAPTPLPILPSMNTSQQQPLPTIGRKHLF